MKLLDFFRHFGKWKDFKESTIDLSKYRAVSNSDVKYLVGIEAFALFSVIDMISGLAAKCEINVYRNGEEHKKQLWDLLNNAPNVNQSAYEFWKEYYVKLLYQKEVLIVQRNDQLIIADSFTKETRAIKESIFTDVTRGDFAFTGKFKSSDVLYATYSNLNADAVISGIFDYYVQLLSTAAVKYHRSKDEKGILKVSEIASGDPDYEETFNELMNEYFRSYFEPGNAVLPLSEGFDYNPGTAESTKKYSNEVSDVKSLFEDAITRACQAYKVPASLMRGDVAGVEAAISWLLTECIDPLTIQLSQLLTSGFYSSDQRINRCSIRVNTKSVEHTSLFKNAAGIDKAIGCGAVSINEVRRELGYQEIDEEFAEKHYITKNYATAELALEGGENNGTENNISEGITADQESDVADVSEE